jgi:hypothetical protein
MYSNHTVQSIVIGQQLPSAMARAPPAINAIKISVGDAAQVRPIFKNARKFTKKKKEYATGTTNICTKKQGCNTSGSMVI